MARKRTENVTKKEICFLLKTEDMPMTRAWIIAELTGKRRRKKGGINALPRSVKFGKTVASLRFREVATILIIKEIAIHEHQQSDIFIDTKNRTLTTERE